MQCIAREAEIPLGVDVFAYFEDYHAFSEQLDNHFTLPNCPNLDEVELYFAVNLSWMNAWLLLKDSSFRGPRTGRLYKISTTSKLEMLGKWLKREGYISVSFRTEGRGKLQ